MAYMIGKKFIISGMVIDIVSDDGERGECHHYKRKCVH